MSKRQNASIYERDLIHVRQHPLKVAVHRLGSDVLMGATWLLGSNVVALRQKGPQGDVVVAREDSPMFDYQPTKLALEYIGKNDEDVRFLDGETFDMLVTAYAAGINNIDNLRVSVAAIEKWAPELRFLPKHLHHLLDNTPEHQRNEYRHLPRMFLRYDLSEYACIAWMNRASGQISPKMMAKWQVPADAILHIGGAWYAFKNLDDAVTAKFYAPATEIHRTREDV